MRPVFVIITGVCLCYLGFYNRFPLVFSDTGAYIWSGFTNTVAPDRPIFYSLFLRHASLSESLWLVILIQGWMLAWSVYFVFKYFAKTAGFTLHYLLFFATVILFTGVSMHVSQLIPDVFTPILLLSFVVLLFAQEISKRDLFYLGFLFVFSLLTHSSHYGIVFIFLLVAGIVFLVRKWRKKSLPFAPSRLALGWSLLLGGWLTLCTLHYSLGGGFAITRSSHVFILSRMIQMDVATDYLECECKNKHYSLCKYLDQIPLDFIWDEKSPFYKTGGWEHSAEEYNEIISNVLTTPKYLKKYLVRCAQSSLEQFFCFDSGAPVMGENSSPFYSIRTYFPALFRSFLEGRQYYGNVSNLSINYTQSILFIVCLLLVFVILFSPVTDRNLKILALSILLLMFCNAAICASLSGVSDRYQSRVAWLIVLPVFISFTGKAFWKDTVDYYTNQFNPKRS